MVWSRTGKPLSEQMMALYMLQSASMSCETKQWNRFPITLLWRHNGLGSVSNHQSHDCLLIRLFRRRSKLRVTGLCVGNSPGIGEFPAQMASYAENVSIWWRYHEFYPFVAANRSQDNKSHNPPPGFYEVFFPDSQQPLHLRSPRFPGDKYRHEIPKMYPHKSVHHGAHHSSNGVAKFRGLVPEKDRDNHLRNVEQALKSRSEFGMRGLLRRSRDRRIHAPKRRSRRSGLI